MCPTGKHIKPPDVWLFSFIDLPDVFTKTKRRHIMSKEKKQLSKKDNNKKFLVVNGKKIPFASPNHPVYKEGATIILRGKPITTQDKKEAKFLEFLSRAPISFEGDE